MDKTPNKEIFNEKKEIEKTEGNCSQNEYQIDMNKSKETINSP